MAIKGVSEIETLSLLNYSSLFKLLNVPLPNNIEMVLDKMVQEKIIKNIHEKEYLITNLGAILFASDLTKFDSISRKAIRVIIYEGNSRLEGKKETTGHRGYAVGFSKLIEFIEERLPSREIIEKSLRKKVSVYPSLAIRELVANALIHQDFSVKGSSPMIEIFDDRIEITNPGKPIIDPLRFVDHSPQSRNEILASIMRRLNICEERGSGIDKVVFECESHRLPAPAFIVGENYTRAILFGSTKLSAMSKTDKIRTCYLHTCLKYVKNEQTTNQTIRERFNIEEANAAMATRIIRETMAASLIKPEDPNSLSKKYIRYVPFWV